MDKSEISLGKPAWDIQHGGWGRSFEVSRQKEIVATGRVVFDFHGDRGRRTFLAEAIFNHDPLCVSFTPQLATSSEAINFIKDDEAAGVLIRTALD